MFESRRGGNIRAKVLVGSVGTIGMTCGGGRDSAIEAKIISGALAHCFGRGNTVSNG